MEERGGRREEQGGAVRSWEEQGGVSTIGEAYRHIVLALAVPRKVDRALEDVEVEQKRHDPRGQVALYSVGDDHAAGIDHLDVAVQRVVERLVCLLVERDALTKVLERLRLVLVLKVRPL